MPLELPNLDDRIYDDLVQEALSLIPTHAPQWTNHNPADPGITLIELFAYLTEMLLYRQNRVTEANKVMFLKLLNGPSWEQKKDLATEIKETLDKVRDRYRAITPEDFEELAVEAKISPPAPYPSVIRAKCVPERNLDSENPLGEPIQKPGHISVIILTKDQDGNNNLQPDENIIDKIKEELEPRRLIGTKIHVVGPRYVTISVRLKIVLIKEANESKTRADVEQALQTFFSPFPNPDEKQLGWPFGRDVYVSEIYQLLDEIEGVDYVEPQNNPDILFLPDSQVSLSYQKRLERNDDDQLIAITLNPEELVNFSLTDSDFGWDDGA
ncbi:MAG: baseplate J/gp47 family protein [Crocosphaera sp.]